MLTPKSKKILSWVIGILFALICFLIVFPVILFVFYPYSTVFIPLYLVLVVLFPVLYFIIRKNVYKKISFTLFFVPACLLIILLILIEVGWIIFPG